MKIKINTSDQKEMRNIHQNLLVKMIEGHSFNENDIINYISLVGSSKPWHIPYALDNNQAINVLLNYLCEHILIYINLKKRSSRKSIEAEFHTFRIDYISKCLDLLKKEKLITGTDVIYTKNYMQIKKQELIDQINNIKNEDDLAKIEKAINELKDIPF